MTKILNAISLPVMLAAAAAVLFNWTQSDSDALWFYINFLMVGACALGAAALWNERRAAGGLLAALAAAVAVMAAVVEPLFGSAYTAVWEVINFIAVIALSFAAGLLLRRG